MNADFSVFRAEHRVDVDVANLDFMVLSRLKKVSEDIQKSIAEKRKNEDGPKRRKPASAILKARCSWDG